MKKINIMYLYSSKGFGGMVQNISLIINYLNQDIFNIIVVALTNKDDKNAEIQLREDRNVIFHRIDENRKLDFVAIHKIRDLLNRYKIDILSCHGYKADFYGFILRRFYRCTVKLIIMAHGWVTPGFKFQLYYFLDKLVMRYFDKIILVAEGLRTDLRGFIIPKHKIIVIHNAIDPENFLKYENTQILRKQFNLDPDDKVVGFAGRLSKEKDIKTTLFAIKKVLSIQKNIKFLIVGDGPQKERLRRISKKLNLGNQVIFAGYQKDIKKIYSILDLYVSSSLKEGLPNSILEAQCFGVPCIATDIPGNNDVIKDSVNGFLVRPRDYKAISEKIIMLLNGKTIADKFIFEGRKNIRENFSLTERIEKLENLYRIIL